MRCFTALCCLVSLSICVTPILAQASATAPLPETSAACIKTSTGSAETEAWAAALANPDYEDAKNHYYSAANADFSHNPNVGFSNVN
jgi:hypothetical protein